MKAQDDKINRRDFFKNALCLAISASLISINDYVEPPYPKPNQMMGHYFKVSNEFLSDESSKVIIQELIQEEIKKYPGRKMVGDIQIGYDGGDEFTKPDFMLNIQTVLFYTEKA